jgi:hypothetical protein
MTFLYVAYGSNLHPLRLAERTPSCRAVGVATLVGYELRFHKRSLMSDDGSGKCDAYATGRPEDAVHGAVYRIDARELAALDAAEGRGYGYERVTAQVGGAGGNLAVQLYVAQPDWIDPGLAPYDWYLELVVRGARHHGLPAAYRRRLAGTRAIRDPDARRSERWLRLAGT